MFSRRRITVALLGLLALVGAGWVVNTAVSEPSGVEDVPGVESGLDVRELSDLPDEAQQTYRLIAEGGPFPHPRRDGSEFGNREQRLPDHDPGYYHEYTVETPGLDHRGARRLVTGAADELYYTEDHYETFVVVDTDR